MYVMYKLGLIINGDRLSCMAFKNNIRAMANVPTNFSSAKRQERGEESDPLFRKPNQAKENRALALTFAAEARKAPLIVLDDYECDFVSVSPFLRLRSWHQVDIPS